MEPRTSDAECGQKTSLSTTIEGASHAPAEFSATLREPEEMEAAEDVQRPQGWSLALIMLGLCLALLCISLDRTIVATAVPRITSDFNSLDDVAWYGSAYLFGSCAFQLLFGKLYTRLSVKWTFVVSLLTFEAGSVICGAAPNSVALILGRTIAGVGCAGVTAGAFIIIAACVQTKDRPKWTGAFSAVTGIAIIASPTLGGALTDNVTWRWCFYLNLPLGGVTLLAIIFLLNLPAPAKVSSVREHLRHLDIPGTLVFIPCVVSLLLALQWAGPTYAWSNWRIILLLVVFGVLGIVWAFIQRMKGEFATVPAKIISQRSVWVGLVHISLIGAGTFIVSYYIPIWFQAVKGYTPQQSGINYLAISGPAALFAIFAGIATSRIGYYVPSMYIGGVFFSVGAGLLQLYDPGTSTGLWAGTSVLLGGGVGFAFQVGMIAAQTVLKDADLSIGTSLMVLGQTLGGAVFLCVGQNIFQNRLVAELEIHAPSVSSDAVVALGASDLAEHLAALFPEAIIAEILESYNLALRRVWIVVLVLVALSLLAAAAMPWVDIRKEDNNAKDQEKK